MIVKKVYNNNIVLVEDEKQLEMILIGRGISFGKKAGDFMDAGRRRNDLLSILRNLLRNFRN